MRLVPAPMLASFIASLLALACAPADAQGVGVPPRNVSENTSVAALIRARDWPAAEAAAARLADPLAPRLVAYFRALTPGAAPLAAIDAFRAANPDWPRQSTLAARREAALAADPDDAAVLASCALEAPRTGPALARCAEALADQDQDQQATAAAEADARAAWIAGPADATWESAFLQRWAAALRPQDQWRRFDRLAWTDPDAARRTLPLLAASDRAQAEARLALRRDEPKASALLAAYLAALPAGDPPAPAIVYEEARWLLHARRDEQARDLLLADGSAAEREVDATYRKSFWTLRDLAARRRLRDGDPAGAYALVQATGQTDPETVGDAAFLAGWIALRALDRPEEARRHFAHLEAVSSAAISRARAHYWLARAALALGQAEQARREEAEAASYPFAYYGQLAALASGADAATLAARILALRDPPWTEAQASDLLRQDLARAAIVLTAWGEPGQAAPFLLRLAELAPDPADAAIIGRLALAIGQPATAVALARRAGRAGVVLPATGWPIAARLDPQAPVDPGLVLGIIRQESSFDPAEISPVGARGLMQLMPATAAAEARHLGVAMPEGALTADPALNVQLGRDYLAGLLSRFDASVPLAVAAYNAGPKRVGEWLLANGDPLAGGRAGHGGVARDMVDWIELIPLAETRNYVQRVIESAVVYRARLGATTAPPVTWTPSPA